MTLWDVMPGIGERFGFHPSGARILELLDGMGPPDRLARCSRCAQRAAEMEEALKTLTPLVPPDAPPHWQREGEGFLRESMAAEAGGALVSGDVLEALLGDGCRGQDAAVSMEIAARLLGFRALARAAAGASPGEVKA